MQYLRHVKCASDTEGGMNNTEFNNPSKFLSGGCKKHSINLVPEIFPAGTDSRYLRAQGIPAYGFSPINNTPILLHDHNEWLGVETFMRGIEILKDVVREVANVSG